MLFDPNTIAIVDDIPVDNSTTKVPEDTGEAMKPHDPANVVDSQDDTINLDNVLNDQDADEAVGTTSIFNYNKSVSTPSSEDIREDLNVPRRQPSAEDAFTNFFTSVESHLVQHETGVNPELTPADRNPQMAVIPLKDPAISKTSDDIKDQNGVLLEDNIVQDNDLEPFDEQNAYDVIGNIRNISQESLLPIHAEDGVTYADIVQDEKYVDTYTSALVEAETQILDIKSQIEECGGIDKSMAIALENIQPGILTSRVSIESFTAYPTKTNLLVSLEATDHWVVGAKVIGGAVIFGLIVKMLLWIRDKLNGTVKVSNQEVSAAKSKVENIISSINDIAQKNIDVIRTSPTIIKNINAECTALLKTNYSAKVDNIAEANNVFLQQYTHQEFKNFSKLHGIIITNKGINGAMSKTAKLLIDKMKELESKFQAYETAFRSTNLMDVSQYTTDWSEATSLLKELGFDNKPSDPRKVGEYMRGMVTTLSKTHQAIPTYQTIAANSYSPDDAAGLDEVKRSIESLLKKVTKLSNDHTTFPDKDIGNNRQKVGQVLKDEVNNLMGISVSAIAIRNTGNGVARKLINVVNKTNSTWSRVFKGSPIKYQPA